MAANVILLPRDAFVGIGSAGGGTRGERRIISLPSPGGGPLAVPRKYVLDGARLLELQQVNTLAPSSWFVDQAVVSSGAPLAATPVDLIFWLLPALRRLASSGQPFSCEAVIAEAAPVGGSDRSGGTASATRMDSQRTLRVLLSRGLPPGTVCAAIRPYVDISGSGSGSSSSSGGAEDSCACSRGVRFVLNEKRATRMLAVKAARVARMLQLRADRSVASLRAQQASFSTCSIAVSEPPTVPATATEAASSALSIQNSGAAIPLSSIALVHWENALEALGEYLNADWLRLVRESIAAAACPALQPHFAVAAGPCAVATRADGGDDRQPSPPDDDNESVDGTSAAPARAGETATEDKAAKWNALALEEESTLRFTRIGAGGGGGVSGDSAPVAKTKQMPSAPTPAQKRLAATNTKGMKSITSFFGGGAQKR